MDLTGEREGEWDRGKEGERETDRQTGRQTETETERNRDRDRDQQVYLDIEYQPQHLRWGRWGWREERWLRQALWA